MAALRRAFVGVMPPPEVLDAVERLYDRDRQPRRRWTRRNQWHITVHYFGRVADRDAWVEALSDALCSCAPVRLQLQGAGAFPRARKAEILWLGVSDPDALDPVHHAVVTAGGGVRARDADRFVPHLTLARLRSHADLRTEVDALDGVSVGPPWTAREVMLLESETRPGGAVYQPHACVRFEGGR